MNNFNCIEKGSAECAFIMKMCCDDCPYCDKCGYCDNICNSNGECNDCSVAEETER